MTSPQGQPPIQTPETEQTLLNLEMRLFGFATRMQRRTSAEHADVQATGMDAKAAPDRTSRRAGFRKKAALVAGGLLSSAAVLVPGAAAAEGATSIDTEKAALAAFGNNAITRSADSFSTFAQESAKRSRKPMKPEGVMKKIRGIYARQHSDHLIGKKAVLLMKRAKLTSQSLVLTGKCSKNDRYVPALKQLVDKTTQDVRVYCYDRRFRRNHDPVDYSSALKRLGKQVANSAGVSAETYGSTSKINATKVKATIRYAQDEAATEGRQLQTLTLRSGKPPIKRWYK